MLKSNIFIIVASALLLTSCTTAQQRVDQLLPQDIALCKQGELTRENALQRRNCIDQATISRLQEAGANDMPLAYQMVTANHTAAVAYSEGKISQDTYNSILQQNTNYYNNTTNAHNSSSDECMNRAYLVGAIAGMATKNGATTTMNTTANGLRACNN